MSRTAPSTPRGWILLVALLIVSSSGLAGCVSPGGTEAEEPDEDLQGGGANESCSGDACPGSGNEDTSSRDGNETRDESNEETPEAPDEPKVPEPPAPDVTPAAPVVAVIDTGINPYHTEFRDGRALAEQHPSTYIPGYPKDAQALELTLDAGSLDAALKADAAKWESVKEGVLYYVPGTRVVGLMSLEKGGAYAGFDENGHGTMSASRAAGATTSLAPEARVVALEGLGPDAVTWAADQSWVDVQTNSWVNLFPSPGIHAAFESAAEEQAVFAASGNGLAQVAGGVGQPAFAHSTQGAPGVIAVGGHDNAEVTLWSGSMPHVIADACHNWAADAGTIDGTGPRVGSGTSSASPYAAGAAAALIHEARRVLRDDAGAHGGGVLARAPEGVEGPESGPLADGDLTLDELKALLFRTADPRPVATRHDGESCGPLYQPYGTTPLEWGAFPEDAPAYYFIGYGAVNVHTVNAAKSVLLGGTEAPARPMEDTFFGVDATLRSATPT